MRDKWLREKRGKPWGPRTPERVGESAVGNGIQSQ